MLRHGDRFYPRIDALVQISSQYLLMETYHQKPLKIGILIDSWTQPAWIADVLHQIQASPQTASLTLILKNKADLYGKRSLIQKIASRLHYFLYSLYRRLDDRKFARANDAFEKKDIRESLQNVPVLEVMPLQKKFSDYLEDEDLARVKGYELDVLIRFGFRILRGGILKAARYGVWSYHHGDNLVNRGGPAGFWEVMQGWPVTGSILQVLTEKLDDGKVIYRSWAPTLPFSVRQNRNNFYAKSKTFVLRKLKDVYARGPQALEDDPYKNQPCSPCVYREPGSLKMVWLLLKFSFRYLKFKWHHFWSYEQWALAFRLGPSCDGIRPKEIGSFQRIIPPKGRFWADPFTVERNGRYYIFIEEYIDHTAKGHISVIEISADGKIQPPVPVLERDYHLSYPFLFEWQDSLYMIPESAQNRSVELYRCDRFPDRWVLEKKIFENINAADTTLFEYEGRWWMFVNLAVEGAYNQDELHLFYADNPLGEWKPHRYNPVVSDVRRARPAGRVFLHGENWYRPAQDCSKRYGYAVSIQKIVRLSPDGYEEQEAARIEPDWNKRVLGVHTLNSTGELTVIDYQAARSRFGG